MTKPVTDETPKAQNFFAGQVDDGECSLCGKELPPEARPIEGRQSPLTLVGQSDSTPPPKQGIQVDDEADPSREAQIAERLNKPAWLLWSNDHRAWHRPDACGYTQVLKDAGRFTLERALKVCRANDYRAGSSLDPDCYPAEMMYPAPEAMIQPNDLRDLLAEIGEVRGELAKEKARADNWESTDASRAAEWIKGYEDERKIAHAAEKRAETAEAELAESKRYLKALADSVDEHLKHGDYIGYLDCADCKGIVDQTREFLDSRPAAPSVDALPDAKCPDCGKPLEIILACSDGAQCCSAFNPDDPRITGKPVIRRTPPKPEPTAIGEFAEHLARGIDGFNNFTGKALIIDWIRAQADSYAAARPSALQQVEAIARDGWVSVKT
jgi:hypothetical protein